MGTHDSIASALFGRTRRDVLGLFFVHPSEDFHMREVIRAVGTGQGAVQRELRRLTDAGILQRWRQGNQVQYRVDRSSPVYSELRSLIVKTVGIADVLREALQPLALEIKFAFIFGSTAKARESRTSDVDLMVIGNLDFAEVVSLLAPVHDRFRREVNAVVYRPREFEQLIAKRHPFVMEVIRQPKIVLFGDERELEKLASEPLARGAPDQRRRGGRAPRSRTKRPRAG